MTAEDLAEIALDIADESEAAVIEGCCLRRDIDGLVWWDTFPTINLERSSLKRAINWLDQRGLLYRDPLQPYLVRIHNVTTFGDLSRAALNY